MSEETLTYLQNGNYDLFLEAVAKDETLSTEEKLSTLKLFGGEPEQIRKLEAKFDISTCSHKSTVGDNYGESCALCGKQMRGMVNGGWFGSNLTGEKKCIHDFFDYQDGYKICRFCEKTEKVDVEPNLEQELINARKIVEKAESIGVLINNLTLLDLGEGSGYAATFEFERKLTPINEYLEWFEQANNYPRSASGKEKSFWKKYAQREYRGLARNCPSICQTVQRRKNSSKSARVCAESNRKTKGENL